MTIHTGKIIKENQVILDNVTIYLNETSRKGFKSYKGHFDTDIFNKNLQGEQLQIVLNDGCSGHIIITNISTGMNSQTGVDFLSTGPLK